MIMNPPNLDPVFPLAGGSFERRRLRPPQLCVVPGPLHGAVIGHRAFMRAWAARRAARIAAADATPAMAVAEPGADPPAAAPF